MPDTKTDPFTYLKDAWSSLEEGRSCEGGLISESFSLWLKSQKKVPNQDPAHYSPKEKMLSVMIWNLFLEI